MRPGGPGQLRRMGGRERGFQRARLLLKGGPINGPSNDLGPQILCSSPPFESSFAPLKVLLPSSSEI